MDTFSKEIRVSTFTGTLVIASLAVVSAVAIVLLTRHDIASQNRQTRNLVIADKHVRVLKPKIAADERFRQISLGSWTACDGALKVDGEVASDADFEDLRRVVLESHPPVLTVLEIHVGPEHRIRTAELRPTEKDGK